MQRKAGNSSKKIDMKRREFIEKTSASAALLSLGLSLSSFKAVEIKHLTILHTNDVHSHIDPFPMDDPRNPNMGGVARRAALIESIRQENPNVLLLDAGDAMVVMLNRPLSPMRVIAKMATNAVNFK